jgi:hypothetical protein
MHEAIEMIGGFRGLNLLGADLVEVSPPFDTTSITAANLVLEMLCVLPGVQYRQQTRQLQVNALARVSTTPNVQDQQARADRSGVP